MDATPISPKVNEKMLRLFVPSTTKKFDLIELGNVNITVSDTNNYRLFSYNCEFMTLLQVLSKYPHGCFGKSPSSALSGKPQSPQFARREKQSVDESTSF
jgi:hypothetical protein